MATKKEKELKEEVKKEVKEDVKEEVKDEVKEEVKAEAKKDFEEEVKKEVDKALREQEEQRKQEEKVRRRKKIRTIIRTIIILLIIGIAIWLLFNRKYDVTFKYNNGEKDHEIQVKFWRKIPEDEVREDLKSSNGAKFIGYFETYYLSGEQIEAIKEDSDKEKSVCKENFKLNSDKTKCVAEDEFNFKKTRIRKNTTIEALWSGESKPAPTPEPDPTPEPTPTPKPTPTPEKDNGTISLSTNKKCIIGSGSITVTATVKDAKDGNVKWNIPGCFTAETSNKEAIVRIGNQCSTNVPIDDTVKASLSNGASSKVDIRFENPLEYYVTDNGIDVAAYDGDNHYKGYNLEISTNVDANFVVSTSSGSPKVSSGRELKIKSTSADQTVTISTGCGQSKVIVIGAIIN